MRNFLIVFPLVLFYSSSLFCQNFQDNNSSSYSDSLVIGTWVLKEVKFIKSGNIPLERNVNNAQDNDNYNSKTDTLMAQNQSYNRGQVLNYTTQGDSANRAILNEKNASVISQEQFNKIMASNDSVIFRYRNSMPQDSVITMVIKSDNTFTLGSKYDMHEGRWQLDKSVIIIIVNDQTNLNNILYLDNKNFIIQNVTDRNVHRMFFEK